tara:strand:- start:2226 stop:2933 length:708 start_codon:yes stop_codon:yes gene_type:complete
MALPKLNTIQYDLELPLSGEKIEYRPFLVKEEKILLMALEGNNEKEMTKAIKQILTQCVLTKGFNVNKLAIVDLEYLFLNLRGKAVGDISTVSFKHECGEIIKLDVDLTKVEVVQNENYSDIVKLTDDIMIRLSPPKIDDVIGVANTNQIDIVMKIIRNSLLEIIQGEEIFSAQDHTKEELDEFVNSLNSAQFLKLQEYYETLPKLKQDIEYTCPKCGKTETETLEGLASFFASA